MSNPFKSEKCTGPPDNQCINQFDPHARTARVDRATSASSGSSQRPLISAARGADGADLGLLAHILRFGVVRPPLHPRLLCVDGSCSWGFHVYGSFSVVPRWFGSFRVDHITERVRARQIRTSRSTPYITSIPTSKGCPMDYPTLPIGFHWAPLGWYTRGDLTAHRRSKKLL